MALWPTNIVWVFALDEQPVTKEMLSYVHRIAEKHTTLCVCVFVCVCARACVRVCVC